MEANLNYPIAHSCLGRSFYIVSWNLNHQIKYLAIAAVIAFRLKHSNYLAFHQFISFPSIKIKK